MGFHHGGLSSSSILFLPSEGILILIPRSDLARETNAVVPSSSSPSFLPQLTNMPAPLKQSTADLSNLMVGFPTLDIFHQFSSPEEGMGKRGEATRRISSAKGVLTGCHLFLAGILGGALGWSGLSVAAFFRTNGTNKTSQAEQVQGSRRKRRTLFPCNILQ